MVNLLSDLGKERKEEYPSDFGFMIEKQLNFK